MRTSAGYWFLLLHWKYTVPSPASCWRSHGQSGNCLKTREKIARLETHKGNLDQQLHPNTLRHWGGVVDSGTRLIISLTLVLKCVLSVQLCFSCSRLSHSDGRLDSKYATVSIVMIFFGRSSHQPASNGWSSDWLLQLKGANKKRSSRNDWWLFLVIIHCTLLQPLRYPHNCS